MPGCTIVDAFSNWLEVIPMTTTTSEKTTDGLRANFATHDLPVVFVIDNGPSLLMQNSRHS